jgi:hypothetical protein
MSEAPRRPAATLGRCSRAGINLSARLCSKVNHQSVVLFMFCTISNPIKITKEMPRKVPPGRLVKKSLADICSLTYVFTQIPYALTFYK